MAISINTYPNYDTPLATNDNGATWGILPSSILATTAAAATVKFTVTTGTPTGGSFITVFGQKFTVGGSNTYNTFIFNSTTIATTISNIIAAMNLNFNLVNNFTTSISGGELTITWKEKGLNESFTFSGFSQCVASDESSGIDDTLLDDYSILFQGLQFTDKTDPSDTNVEPFTALKKTDAIIVNNAVIETPINLNRYLKNLLWSDFNKDIVFDDALKYDLGGWVKIKLKAGEQQKISGAIVQTDVKQSENYKVINAKLKASELNLNPFVFSLGIGATQAKFLNQRPNKFIFADEYVNLYFLLHKPIAEGFNYRITATGTKTDNTTFTETYTLGATIINDYILIIPCGVVNGSLLSIPSNAQNYSVTVYCQDENLAEPSWQQASETYNFEVIDCDCCKEEIYFQSEKGAFDTLRVQRIESKSISTSQSEILKDVVTLAGVQTLDEKIRGSVQQINTVSSEKYIFVTDEVMMTDSEIDYFRQFKQSERRYIKQEINGTLYVVPFIVEPNETVVYQYGDTIKMQITGYLGNGQYL